MAFESDISTYLFWFMNIAKRGVIQYYKFIDISSMPQAHQQRKRLIQIPIRQHNRILI